MILFLVILVTSLFLTATIGTSVVIVERSSISLGSRYNILDYERAYASDITVLIKQLSEDTWYDNVYDF